MSLRGAAEGIGDGATWQSRRCVLQRDCHGLLAHSPCNRPRNDKKEKINDKQNSKRIYHCMERP